MRQHPHLPTQQERRNYFRIEASVLLNYMSIDETAVQNNQIPSSFSQDQRFSLMRELQDIDHESSKHLRAIIENSREVEAYLKLMNKKIDTLAAALANTINPDLEQKNRSVSLSEAGLSFHTKAKLVEQNYLALQITLLPSYVTLVLFAKIIHCSAEDNGFKIAVNFVNLKDSDRQLLAKHIMQLQLAEKRKQHSEKN